MSVAIITGSAGLIGSEATRHFARQGLLVVGIDNDMRSEFFGREASTAWQALKLRRELDTQYRHCAIDIRNDAAILKLFREYGDSVSLIVHTAAQPSHDWASQDPQTDFAVNAQGTLNLLESARRYSPHSVFLFTSTNKVYGDAPNRLPLIEHATRYEIDQTHTYANGIREDMSIDQTLHSVFGASKVAADVLVQEYGRYFGLQTVCFRCGCLTGPNHSGTELHGFLAYMMKCCRLGRPYSVFGYGGKQVRDNIHSSDLISAFDAVFHAPRVGEVYNLGGGRESNCSLLEAIRICEEITGRELNRTYQDRNRIGDHIWWISSLSRFRNDYPEWRLTYDVRSILEEIHAVQSERHIQAMAI